MSFYKFLSIVGLVVIFISFTVINKAEAEGVKDSSDELYSQLKNSGEEYLRDGKFDSAIQAFSQALILVREVKQDNGEIECLMRLGLLYWNVGQLEASSKYYIKALSLARKAGLKNLQEKCQKALVIYNLYRAGKRNRDLEKYQNSINDFNKAIQISKEIGSKEHVVKCLRQLSITYWRLDNLKQFYLLNNEALNLAREINHRKEEVRCLNNIGLFYKKSNNYSKALAFYNNSMKLAKLSNIKDEISTIYNNIGVIYKELGFPDRSIKYLKDSINLDEKIGDSIKISMGLNNIGEIFRNNGLIFNNKKYFYEALLYFNKSLNLIKDRSNKRIKIRIFNNIGTVYLDLHNYDQALYYFRLGYKTAQIHKDLEAEAMIINNIGLAYFNIGNYKDAIKLLHQSIEAALPLKAKHILWEAYFWLAKCYEKENQFSEARIYYYKAMDVIDDIRSQVTLDIHKTGFVRDKLIVYESLINLLSKLERKNPSFEKRKEIFYAVEKAKARSFLESLKESKIDIKERLTPELKKREYDISRQIASATLSLSQTNISRKEREQIERKLKQKEEEYTELISEIRMKIPAVARLISPKLCDLQEVQNKLLDKRTALIEYFLGERQSFMFVVTQNKLWLYDLPPSKEIEDSIKAYLKLLSQPPTGRFKGSLGSKRIYRLLLKPAKANFSHAVENLIIVPDGILYYLPFETLMTSGSRSSSSGEFLIKKFKISYSPSASSSVFLKERLRNGKNKKGLLAFGNPFYRTNNSSKDKKTRNYAQVIKEMYASQGFDFSPLPFSEKEVKQIAKYFAKDKRDVYLKKRATEDIIKRLPLNDYQIIHFACHGFLDENFPFRSALVLSLDNNLNEDGFLQVRELYNLRMKASLVVLSACQTGKGKLEKFEGVLGLPRIFFYAGAESVLMTLWKVNDKATAIFMEYLYSFLSKGKTKAEALRLAKLKMAASRFSHPFYWAGFILNGDSSSRVYF